MMHQASFAERDKHLWPAVGLGAAHVLDRAAGADASAQDCRRLGPHPSSSGLACCEIVDFFLFFPIGHLFFPFSMQFSSFFFNFPPFPVKNIFNFKSNKQCFK